MRAAGIIAEYNPFHNGHAYQIQKARELSHADYIIVAMSGNFVQRGAPAILDKFARAHQALANGADFVFELPTIWATASAEYFAAAGTALFRTLGCVKALSFGCETPNLPLLTKIAKILAEEPSEYKTHLTFYLKQGLPFPSARENAILSCIAEPEEDVSSILRSPNNILALEYIKAIDLQKSPVRPLPIQRKGSGYHAKDLPQTYCSASAIRSFILNATDTPPHYADTSEILSNYVPSQTAEYLLSPNAHFLTEQDFSEMLYYKLLTEREAGFSDYADISPDLSNKIIHSLTNFTDYKNFCKILKSKEITYTRISRGLSHILLNIKKSDYEKAKNCGYIPYLRLLGFRKEASSFFSEIKKHTRIPLITKPSRYASLLDEPALSMFRQDITASDLYYGTLAQKSSAPQKNEYQRSLVIL